MLNSRQRAQLRAAATNIDTILHVGKGGITENIVVQACDALKARELIKGKVLDNCELSAAEVAEILAERCSAESVQSIGSKFVLFKENKSIDKDKRIKLVK